MSDDLTVMGIAATAAAAMGREQIVLAHQAEHPLAGNPDVATDPKPSPDLAVALALPGRCLQVGFDRHQQRLVRDRGLRSPTLCRRLLGVLAGGHGVERGAGHAPGGADPPQAVGQARAGRGGGTHRRDLRRPKGPKVSVLASSSSTCMVNSPIRFMALSSSACTGIALALLERGVDPADRFLHAHCSSRKISTPNWRDRSCTGSSRKAAERPHACAPPSIAGQVPAGLPAKPGLGKTWTSQARPHLPQAHQQQLSSQNYRSCSGPPWTLRLSQFCVQGNRVRLRRLSRPNEHPSRSNRERSRPAYMRTVWRRNMTNAPAIFYTNGYDIHVMGRRAGLPAAVFVRLLFQGQPAIPCQFPTPDQQAAKHNHAPQ